MANVIELPVARDAMPRELAGRAVAMCAGCPMAQSCSTKSTGECPPPAAMEKMMESVETGGGAVSYRKQLMDDSQPVVMANLQPKKMPEKPKPQPRQQKPKVKSPVPITPKQRVIKTPERKVSRNQAGTIGAAVAELMHLIFSVDEANAA